MALEATFHIALGCQGFGMEDALCHLLNLCWPNAFEISAHVIQRFIFVTEGMRVSLGPARLFQYLLQVGIYTKLCSLVQGLFHPARKVREPYWKVFNNLILGNQDAMVAAYPKIPNESERNQYVRYELDYVL